MSDIGNGRAEQDDRGNPPPMASGGELMWYRHLGQSDGTNKWEGANKVGNR